MDIVRDQSVDCGPGWHFTNIQNAVAFSGGGKKHKIISATIKLEDILAIHGKVRARAYSNVQIVKLFD